jgi:hypothetical protein
MMFSQSSKSSGSISVYKGRLPALTIPISKPAYKNGSILGIK